MSSWKREPVSWENDKDLEVYMTDWIECDENIDVSSTDVDDKFIPYPLRDHPKKYTIFGFGCTSDGHSVSIKIVDYHPYYYLKIPEEWNKKEIKEFQDRFLHNNYINDNDIDDFKEFLHNNPKWYPKFPKEKMDCPVHKSSIIPLETEIVEKEIFWTFTNHKKYKFWKLNFKSKNGAKLYHSYLKYKQRYPIQYGKSEDKKGLVTTMKLFESELEPLLRFFHDNKIEPSNWITIPAKSYKMTSHSYCQISVETNYKNIIKLDKQGIPPLLGVSFDIEAGSSHGDFPVARKDTKKLANELVIAFLRDRNYVLKYKDIYTVANKTANDNSIKLEDLDEEVNKSKNAYFKALNNIRMGDKFFKERIIQAVGHYLRDIGGTAEHVDNDISEIYFKKEEHNNIDKKINSPLFDKLVKDIYFICDRPIRKIQANREMKMAVTKIMSKFEELEEKQLKESKINKPPTIKKLLKLIETTIEEINNNTKTKLKEEAKTKGKRINKDDLKKKIIDPIVLRDKVITKDILVKFVNNLLKNYFGKVEGDRVIQIGSSFFRFGTPEPVHHNIVALGSCDDLDGIEVEAFKNIFKKKKNDELNHNDKNENNKAEINDELNRNELNLLIRWTQMIRKYDPDVIVGYNIFGFDEIFMYDRIQELLYKTTEIYANSDYKEFINIGRLKPDVIKKISECSGRLIEKKLSSSALGDNYLYYFNMPGRVQIDLLKVVQADVTKKLPSYKLDSVAETYIGGEVLQIGKKSIKGESHWIKVEYSDEISIGNYIIISMATGEQFLGGKKIKVIRKEKDNNCIKSEGFLKLNVKVQSTILEHHPTWGLGKDDVSPKEIFQRQLGTSEDRAVIAKYCIQDCALVIRLLNKFKIIMNNSAMSNVCLVPLSYIFMRGQSIKIFSLIVNECSSLNYVIPVLDKIDKEEEESERTIKPFSSQENSSGKFITTDDTLDEMKFDEDFNVIQLTDDGYEGAIVLVPVPGIYIEDPVTVLDFASLYPSEMIASNLSHDSHCENEYWLGDEGADRIKALGYDYKDITYDILTWVDPNNKGKGKHKIGEQTERFVQYSNGEKGLIPKILMKLLAARKATKKEMKTVTDPFAYAILDGKQLALKVTCNSVYGQTGASISKIYKKAIAASTTAGGRNCIYRAKDYVLENNKGCEVVYGDTDSVFVKFNLEYPDGTYPKTHQEKIQRSIDIGLALQQKLKDDKYYQAPHDLEYEKVFCPLMLITKKRYAGEKYEFNADKSKFTSMGIVLKRRDNAPILKYTYQGVMNKIMKELSIVKAIDFVKLACQDLLNNKFDLNMFVISKTLRDYYKDPESIAHKVLANRMGERDPGNKPTSNERIPYAYIQVKEKNGIKLLQGDRIENLDYIKDKKLKLDYHAYINSQLLKPICQVFELVVESMDGYPYHATYFQEQYQKYYQKYDYDVIKTDKKISELKQKVVANLIFEDYLVKAYNQQNNVITIDKWIQTSKKVNTKEKKVFNLEEKQTKFKIVKKKQLTVDSFLK